MADLNFVGRNLVTRNADGTYGQALEEDVVGIQNLPFRLSASQVGNADLIEIDLLPALGAAGFYVVHGFVSYAVENGGVLPASGDLKLIYGGTAQDCVSPQTFPPSSTAVNIASGAVLVFDSAPIAIAGMLNKSVSVKAASAIPIPGVIASTVVDNGGTGYAINDLFNIISTIDASVIGTGRVTSVAAGVVDGYEILTATLGAIRGIHNTVKTSGAGDDAFTLDVLGVNYSTNSALILGKLFYSTHSNVV